MILSYKKPLLGLFKSILSDMLIVAALCGIVYSIQWKWPAVLPNVVFGVPAFLGTAISILLSFKIGQSYDRWWEARKIWGAIVNDSRSFVLQLQGLLPQEEQSAIQQMTYRQIAWCWGLGRGLRQLETLDYLQATHLLNAQDMAHLKPQKNIPLSIIQLNSQQIKALRAQGQLDVFGQLQLDDTLVRLVASMGKAERIKSTVFPTTYRMMLHLIIYAFAICLIFACKTLSIAWSFPLIMTLVTIFFLLERTAYNLQDPFENRPSDTAVSAIARTIEINLRQLIGEEELPAPWESEDYYLM
ncbi:MAG: bestrophin family protein [Aureispira sp.]